MNMNLASKWEDAFLERMKVFSSNTFTIVYEHSASLDKELNANISSDITFFFVTFTLMIMFAGFVLMGGNCVSNRYNLGLVGTLSTGLAIVAALGIASAVGVKFVSIVGTMPILIIGKYSGFFYSHFLSIHIIYLAINGYCEVIQIRVFQFS